MVNRVLIPQLIWLIDTAVAFFLTNETGFRFNNLCEHKNNICMHRELNKRAFLSTQQPNTDIFKQI